MGTLIKVRTIYYQSPEEDVAKLAISVGCGQDEAARKLILISLVI